jgi:regulator of sirC expression with transglutaminase-like and TPR domain
MLFGPDEAEEALERLELELALRDHTGMTDQDPAEYLRALGQAGEGPYDLAEAALMLAALDHSRKPLAPYRAHLAEIGQRAKDAVKLLGQVDDVAHAISTLLVGIYGYDGDRMSYDDPQNANLMAVIDRRRGLPVALGILYIHAARAAGLSAQGVNSPGHFLLRIVYKGDEMLIDPFNGGVGIDQERLGGPPRMGAASADDPRISEPVSDAEVLIRLQNNQKLRALNGGDRQRALDIAKRMVLIAPKRSELWMDLARLNEALGSLGAAQKSYEACLSLSRQGTSLHNEAALGLYALKRKLN